LLVSKVHQQEPLPHATSSDIHLLPSVKQIANQGKHIILLFLKVV